MLRAITNEPEMRERSVVRLSVTPSTKYSCSGSPPRLAKGRTTMERRGGLLFRRGAWRGLLGADASLQRIDPHRLGDVLELGLSQIDELLGRAAIFTCR